MGKALDTFLVSTLAASQAMPQRIDWRIILTIVLWFAFQLPASASKDFIPSKQIDLPSTELVWSKSHPQDPIEIVRFRSGVLPGVTIGGYHEGFFQSLKNRYTATGRLEEAIEDAARSLIESELSEAGLNVVRSFSESVFAEQFPTDPEPGRFLLGGTITQAKLNSYHSWLGDRTNDERTIRWEVFDREANTVIYSQSTTGLAQVEGVENLAATYSDPCQRPSLACGTYLYSHAHAGGYTSTFCPANVVQHFSHCQCQSTSYG